MKPAIQCKYSCFKCGIKRQIVTIKAREDEEIVDWVNGVVAPVLAEDHARRSPGCHISKFDEVMIPITEGVEKIGAVAYK